MVIVNGAPILDFGFCVYYSRLLFSCTFLVTPWILPSEIFPLKLRAAGNAAGVVGWSIGNGWLMLLCPIMFDHIGEKSLYIFGASNFLTLIIVHLFYPETANRTLEEIDFLFASGNPLASSREAESERLKQVHAMAAQVGEEGIVIEEKEQDDHKEIVNDSSTSSNSATNSAALVLLFLSLTFDFIECWLAYMISFDS